MHKILIDKILFEIEQINMLLEVHSELITICKQKEPDSTELAAIGTILHSFYNGLEKVFIFVAKDFDSNLPVGQKWHRDIIKIMCKDTDYRSRVIPDNLEEIIIDYLGFRHYFRHSYDFTLDWSLIKNKFLNLKDNWSKIKLEILFFIEHIS